MVALAGSWAGQHAGLVELKIAALTAGTLARRQRRWPRAHAGRTALRHTRRSGLSDNGA